MAESVSRRATLQSAWADYWSDEETCPPINHYFECGFDAAWDALMAEIEPLVANVLTFSEIKRALIPARVRHLEAVNRLRELVREGE